jgi:antitoxin (DNA-binding transcriptional repressor) of toxin-antitoxin stability system
MAMERYELTGGDERIAAMVEAAKGGEDVTITRDGAVVARVVVPVAPVKQPTPTGSIDLEAIEALHAALPAGIKGGDGSLVRQMRDMDDR